MATLNFQTKITKFYPYDTVTVQDRILDIEGKEEREDIKDMIEKKLNIGFRARYEKAIEHIHRGKTIGYCNLTWDNKIVFECKVNNKTFYIQFYDNVVTIGLSVIARNFDPEKDYIEIINK